MRTTNFCEESLQENKRNNSKNILGKFFNFSKMFLVYNIYVEERVAISKHHKLVIQFLHILTILTIKRKFILKKHLYFTFDKFLKWPRDGRWSPMGLKPVLS